MKCHGFYRHIRTFAPTVTVIGNNEFYFVKYKNNHNQYVPPVSEAYLLLNHACHYAESVCSCPIPAERIVIINIRVDISVAAADSRALRVVVAVVRKNRTRTADGGIDIQGIAPREVYAAVTVQRSDLNDNMSRTSNVNAVVYLGLAVDNIPVL